MNEDPEKVLRLRAISKNVSQNIFIIKDNPDLVLYPESSSDDDDATG